MAAEVKGTLKRNKATDCYMKCQSCGRIFYYEVINGTVLICPHCGRRY